jgi:hypothetical protein
MADQNKVLIRLVYGADHSLSPSSQEYELAEEIRRDERDACAGLAERRLLIDKNKNRIIGYNHAVKEIVAAIRARGET